MLVAPGSLLLDAVGAELGGRHSCAVMADGRALCGGNNGLGALGRPSGTAAEDAMAGAVQFGGGPLDEVRQIALGSQPACALVGELGKAVCWGRNSFGQLGRPNNNETNAPALLEASTSDLTGIVQLAAGHSVTCAVVVNKIALCWGSNISGQLGAGPEFLDTSRFEPGLVRDESGAPLVEVTKVTMGLFHGCALHESSQVSCWGDNTYGQVGADPALVPVSPVARLVRLNDSSPLEGVAHVAAGYNHTCALLGDGKVFCWGLNDKGQLGRAENAGTFNPNPTPGEVEGLSPPT